MTRPSLPPPSELVQFPDRPYRHRLAMHTGSTGGWLDIDSARDFDLGERRRRIETEEHRVVVREVGEERTEALLVEAVAPALAARGLLLFADADPLVAVGSSTQEDWCLLRRVDGVWRFVSGVVCFPTAWEARDKLGVSVLAIHDPVPGYADEIGRAVDRSLDRLQGIAWRRNWSLVATSDLWVPPGHGVATLGNVGSEVWLRVERQTFRRLADDVIAFGIRIHRWPLNEALSPPNAAGLARMIRTMSPGFRAYKELIATHHDAILVWLDQRAGE